jgi:hypothetical protein
VKTVVVTDDDGIFDASGSPVGQYSVEIKGSNQGPVYELDLRKVPVKDVTFFVDNSPKPNRQRRNPKNSQIRTVSWEGFIAL